MQEPKFHLQPILLRGTIANLQRSRRTHDFVLTRFQQNAVGATAMGAAAIGLGATGIGLVNMASDADEEADWVEFELDGMQMQGWLWLLPMRNGDVVELVAEKVGENRYVVYSVKRDGDDIVSVYPHATAGRKQHYRSMEKIMFWAFVLVNAIGVFAMHRPGDFGDNFLSFAAFMGVAMAATLVVFLVIFYRVTKKMMGFVRLAEAIFKTYGWPDVENINLRKTSCEHRGTNTLANYGRYYFRYK
ncbi:putative type VI secretion system effector [Paraburkholderia sp. RL17-381-BIF-C]|uniref:putative type VI secretion system effector n=1 Tax=Paraburkholderia sp. RL17-381-BIF-C TaxID=3031635 RepID=UPI0038BDFE25